MKKILIPLFTFIVLSSCSKEESTDVGVVADQMVNMSEREKALADYEEYYVKTKVSNPKWTGSDVSCVAGDVDRGAIDELMKTRLNYFRRLVGLHDIVVNNNPVYINQCQEAAVMMSANLSVTHYPPKNWHCYTEEGAEGAANSQLTIDITGGAHTTGGIPGFIEDVGSHNKKVGHRRWLLYSKATSFTYGSTYYTGAIRIHSDGGVSNPKEYVAYPDGYFPENLVYPRWSFAVNGAFFEHANVKMVGPDGEVPVEVIHRYKQYDNRLADYAIVWEPAADFDVSGDTTYTVTITGIENAPQTTYTYDVVVIDQD